MATPTLQDLLAPQTSDAALTTLLQRLAGQGFPVTTWQPGDLARTLLQLQAEGAADSSSLLVAIASGGFAALAQKDWLTLVAKQVYGLDRNPALFTKGTCVLDAAASSPGYSILPGQLVAVSASGKRFINTTSGNLPAGGEITLTFQAESPGSSYNVSNDSITTLATPLPGVTISNPDTGSGTWITDGGLGTDAESDTSLQGRCAARWPSLAAVPTIDVFDLWAKAASDQVTRTLSVTSTTVPGEVDLYLAGSSGGVDGGAVAAVQAYADARMPLTSTCVASSATSEPIQVNATLYVKAGKETTAAAAAQAAVEALISATDINGTLYQAQVEGELEKPTVIDPITLKPVALQPSDSGIVRFTIQVLARQSVGSGVGDIDLSAISGGPHVATPVVTLAVVTV